MSKKMYISMKGHDWEDEVINKNCSQIYNYKGFKVRVYFFNLLKIVRFTISKGNLTNDQKMIITLNDKNKFIDMVCSSITLTFKEFKDIKKVNNFVKKSLVDHIYKKIDWLYSPNKEGFTY